MFNLSQVIIDAKKALEEERDIESNVIIKSDNMQFIEILVEILKLNNRDKDSDNANKDTLQFEKEFKEDIIAEEAKEDTPSEDVKKDSVKNEKFDAGDIPF